MLYSVGDVVKSYYYWIERDGSKRGTTRPVIIKEIVGINYVIVKISRSCNVNGLIRIRVHSKEWKQMGLYDWSKDSWVDKNAIRLVSEGEIERKIGECPTSIFEAIF